jgi:hypothetical protein
MIVNGIFSLLSEFAQMTRIQVLADDRQWNLLAVVRVCANDKSDALLVDLPAFQLMGC